ncbi:hypothetical protein SAMD00019534_103410, partial [Acytostelium subglobosum LB1]|uniref:hypothetical protein n=1 Tax=Acytostelium subglobosum LB1 TaxID=1410327 RepID=UPI000644D0BF
MMNIRFTIITIILGIVLLMSATTNNVDAFGIPYNYNFDDFEGASVAVSWVNVVLRSISVATNRPAPPHIARILSMFSTAMYDSWAYYDIFARGVYLDNPRHGRIKASQKDIETAVSFAAYRVMVDLMPAAKPMYDAKMLELNLNISITTTNPNTPAGVGNLAASLLQQDRWFDGANQKGDMPGSRVAGGNYSDYTNYAPRNDPYPARMRMPDNWQPLNVPVAGTNTTAVQAAAAPHWGMVKPFSLFNGAELRPKTGPMLYSNAAMRPTLLAQAQELINYTINMTDEQKVIAEYFADGPQSVLPPGHWFLFSIYVSERDQNNLRDDIKMFFMLGNAVHDAAIACWDTKRFYDNSRPATLIPFLFAGQNVTGWHGICSRNVTYDLVSWVPYQSPNVWTPPFQEFNSGHSTFSAASAEILKRFTGSDAFGLNDTVPAGWSKFEGFGVCAHVVPATNITLSWPTFTAAADMAGMSRRYGGIHFESGDLTGRALGRQVGEKVWLRSQLLFNGFDPDFFGGGHGNGNNNNY